MERLTLTKEERLCSQITIGKLFSEGESFLVHPVKTVFLKTALPSKYPAQASFSVSKRSFKKSVSRNLVKRRMREAYRTHKYLLYENLVASETQLAVMFIFTGKKIVDYPKIESAITSSMKKILKKIQKKEEHS